MYVKEKEKRSETWSVTTGEFMQITLEKSPTILSRDYKDAPCVCVQKKYLPKEDGITNGKRL